MLWLRLLVAAVALSASSAYTIEESIGTCDHGWQPSYTHTTMGMRLLGSKATLKKNILQGEKVRIQIANSVSTIAFTLNDITFRGKHICGTSAWMYSNNGSHVDTNADWTPTLVCTTGEISRLKMTTANWTRPVTTEEEDPRSMLQIWWFTKPASCQGKAIYSNFVDGSPAGGSFKKLVVMAKWSDIRVSMRDRGFFTSIENTRVFNEDELVTAQSVAHFGMQYTHEAVQFNSAPYYNWMAMWASDGHRDVSRWYLNNVTQLSHSHDFVALDWYADECWRKVYVTDEWGFVTHGSLEELIVMIRLGHRVRIHFDGFNIKANGIRVIDNLVVAQTIEEYGRRGGYPEHDAGFFHDPARIIYRLIHSTGVIKTYQYNIDNFQSTTRMVKKKYPIQWLVDTRQWVKVYRTDALGQVTYGEFLELEDAISLGAEVRLNIEQDELAGQFFTEADSVIQKREDFMATEIYAQALKHVSDQKLQTSEEYVLQKNVFQWALMVGTDGVVAMNARSLASKTHLYDAVSPLTNVTWFVNL